ncbi:MAG: family 43 glycosylhydrolase [Oscillospiraceae bacterium]|nr:family 43 glycosylhydrolase [Oscillospiraceae bacterium]
MKRQVFNPYLPSWEYIPDGEPRVFGDRVYVYGSHDHFNAPIFCVGDYVCWSAPVNDLSDWRYEGVIYKKNQDPRNKLGLRLLFAPDVVRGVDGRYYLYYAFDFMGMTGVAVCDTPAGEYQFLGHVHYADGTIWGRRKGDQFPFDPGVLVDDDGRVWHYSGFYTPTPAIVTGGIPLKNDGGVVMELEQDMVTIKGEPKVIFPKEGPGSFENHEFFEASSIRKDGDRYIFVYSSRHNHELCYAVSHRPDGDFRFGGTLVSLGDLFLDGRTEEKNGLNYLGNTHGGMLNLGDDWYIFYHRQTNRHSYSRQACAEKLVRTPDGRFLQAEVTSCGLNGGPLKGKGKYEARIACNLWSKDGVGRYDGPRPRKRLEAHPYFTQSGKDRMEKGDQYIANIRDGAVAGFKYFDFRDVGRISLGLSGRGVGVVEISTDPEFRTLAGWIPVTLQKSARTFFGNIQILNGVQPLYFRYRGSGAINFHWLQLE